MRSVFADTYYFIALLSASDQAHDKAVEVTRELNAKMVTTSWILTELADGMASPSTRKAFLDFLDHLRADPDVAVVPPDVKLFEEGIALHGSRLDKAWSLTDCTSFVVMEKQGIREALTGDQHFEQAGFVPLLK